MVQTASQTNGNLEITSASNLFDRLDIPSLSVTITQETSSRTRIYITDSTAARWEIPAEVLPRPGGEYTGDAAATTTVINQLERTITTTRLAGGGEVVFNISMSQLVFQDQYLQLVLNIPPDASLFGFGESSRTEMALHTNTIYTLWNSDFFAANYDASLYGSHPFYVQVTSAGDAVGVFFANSNGMDVSLWDNSPLATEGQTLGIQAVGGVIELYVFAGPSPREVVQQYLEVIGRPAMLPHWSLGFHNCRWGYPNISYVEEVVANYSKAEIPLETQWLDIDYMSSYLDFTFDAVTFPQEAVADFVTRLHERGQRFVPIVDPGIHYDAANYDVCAAGLEQNVFIADLRGENPYLGQVWPGPTYFPDWFAVNASSFWSMQLSSFHKDVSYDGIWIDMNEIASFCNVAGTSQVCSLFADEKDNQCAGAGTRCCLNCSVVDALNPYDFPPFVPHCAHGSMGGNTIAMSSVHAGTGGDEAAAAAATTTLVEYNTHNLYGLMESKATYDALQGALGINRRPFILSRSTFPGSGRYTAHWTGDNNSTWTDLSVSIVTMSNMALFGIPMVGADICGLLGDATEELCARWIQVGAFSPFARNHNNKVRVTCT